MMQKNNNRFKAMRRFTVSLLVLFAVFGVSSVAAQSSGGSGEVTAEELEQFAAALEQVQSIQQEMVQSTQGAVADSSLEQSRFQELYRAESGGPAPSSAPSDEEQAQFDELMGEIQQIQESSNQQMIEAVQEEGLDVQRFNQIARAIQQNPELQQRFQELQGS